MHCGCFCQILSEKIVVLKFNWIGFNKIGKRQFQIIIFFANFKVPFNSNLPLWSATSAGKRGVLATSSRVNVVHGLRTSRESFFSKIRNFWAWADKLGRNFMRHLGYFWPNYKHYFGTVSPLSMGKSSWFYFLQKTLVFRPKTHIFPLRSKGFLCDSYSPFL